MMNRNIHTKYILINKDILVNAYTMGKYPNNQQKIESIIMNEINVLVKEYIKEKIPNRLK